MLQILSQVHQLHTTLQLKLTQVLQVQSKAWQLHNLKLKQQSKFQAQVHLQVVLRRYLQYSNLQQILLQVQADLVQVQAQAQVQAQEIQARMFQAQALHQQVQQQKAQVFQQLQKLQ